MKNLFAVALALLLASSLIGCGNGEKISIEENELPLIEEGSSVALDDNKTQGGITMRKVFAVLSVVSLWLLALVNFCKNAFEAYLHVQLVDVGNYTSSQYTIDAQMCQIILIVVAIVCAAVVAIDIVKNRETSNDK